MNHDLNVLIIGAGMYVCGRGSDGFGTVIPALCEWLRQGRPLGHVTLAATSARSAAEAAERLGRLNQRMGTDLVLTALPATGGDKNRAYVAALASMPKPACAIVVVPDHLHCPVATDCLKAGLHTLIVKPLTPTVAEAQVLVDLQQRYRLYGAVEFHKRFDRANLKMKEYLQRGAIGTPLYFIVEYSQRKHIPTRVFTSWVDRTNVFQYLGVHYVDIIYFVTGATPVTAMAIGQTGWLQKQGVNAFDAVHATIGWRTDQGDRFWSYIFTNWTDPEGTSAMSDQKIKVIGTRGRFESDQKCRGQQAITDEGGIEDINPDFCTTYPDANGVTGYQGYGIQSIHTFLQDVMDLNSGRTSLGRLETCRPSFRSSLASTAVVEAVNTSLGHGGQWVDIDDSAGSD